jgi:hypothetical protein
MKGRPEMAAVQPEFLALQKEFKKLGHTGINYLFHFLPPLLLMNCLKIPLQVIEEEEK